jgi:peptidyl-prolyl cis-trans isomerase SurA
MAQRAYSALDAGMPWEKAVSKFSQDRASQRKGGTIGWINYGRLDPSFVETIMSIDTTNTFTDPVKSKYGYHILRIDSIRSFASDSAKRAFMSGKLKELPRYKQRKKYVHRKIEKLGNAEKFTAPLTSYADFQSGQDTMRIGTLSPSESLASSRIYTINNESYSVSDFHNWLTSKHGDTPASRYRAKWFDDYKLSIVTNHLVPLTKERFQDFDDKIKNYMDGLVVFQVTQDSVWNYAQSDTARLKEIYKAKRDSFRYGKRYHYYMFMSQSDSLLQKAVTGFKERVHPDTLDKKLKGLAIRTDSTSYVGDFPFNKLPKMQKGTFSNLVKYKNRKAYLYLNEVLDPRRMTFEEAYNRLVSYYQPIREEEWIESLKKRHNVKVYQERLEEKLAEGSQSR